MVAKPPTWYPRVNSSLKDLPVILPKLAPPFIPKVNFCEKADDPIKSIAANNKNFLFITLGFKGLKFQNECQD